VVERDVIIVGAGPAGLSAAIFTQIDGWSTLVLEANWVGGWSGHQENPSFAVAEPYKR